MALFRPCSRSENSSLSRRIAFSVLRCSRSISFSLRAMLAVALDSCSVRVASAACRCVMSCDCPSKACFAFDSSASSLSFSAVTWCIWSPSKRSSASRFSSSPSTLLFAAATMSAATFCCASSSCSAPARRLASSTRSLISERSDASRVPARRSISRRRRRARFCSWWRSLACNWRMYSFTSSSCASTSARTLRALVASASLASIRRRSSGSLGLV
mmetsp:Transcript_29840/g.88359  ORF Transcript_29840/g.88359 Transcript_29840/m.88359 type:complete len:216 (-) Transcript_29840:3105-3752(-)